MALLANWTDQKVEDIVAVLLRSGVLLSAAVVFCGAVIYLARHGHTPADYHIFRGEPTDLRSISGIIRDAVGLQGRGIIQLGLLLLIATPVARVAFAVFGFAAERDRMYVIFTLIVLTVLLYSLVGSS
ncbi:MAG TPA: DUF1634 domain-containing protein [Terriglobales bacterium]|jgi:uncharacterized membrane protein|nr:DUF1634 domain-containing protein [Terriglobales bacterium]